MADKYEITESQISRLFATYQKIKALGEALYFTEPGDYPLNPEQFSGVLGDAVRHVAGNINELIDEVHKNRLPQ